MTLDEEIKLTEFKISEAQDIIAIQRKHLSTLKLKEQQIDIVEQATTWLKTSQHRNATCWHDVSSHEREAFGIILAMCEIIKTKDNICQ